MSLFMSRGLLVSAALLLVFFRAFETIRSDDFFMGLALGRRFFESGGLGEIDPFLFSIPDFHWHVWHQWLAYIYYYALYSLGGFSLIILFKSIWVTFMAALIVYVGRVRPSSYVIMVLAAAFFVAMPRLFADRAAVFTDLLTLMLLTVLLEPSLHRRIKWGIPFLFLFWVQLHPGFVLGFILLGINLAFSKSRKESSFVFLLSLLAVLINPLGMEGAIYPLRTVLSSEWNLYRTMNSEWVPTLSLTLLPVSYRLLFAAFVFGSSLWVCLRAWKARDFQMILFSLFLLALGLSALRFVVISGLGLGILLVRYPPEGGWWTRCLTAPATQVVTAIFLLSGFVWTLSSQQYGPRILAVKEPIHYSLPFKSARLFAQLPPGRIWNDFDLGGLLIWELNGRMPIAAHGHIDRPSLVVSHYQRWTASEADFAQLIDGQNVEYFYLRRSSLLAERDRFWPKKLVTEWDLVYEDAQAVVFRRRPAKGP